MERTEQMKVSGSSQNAKRSNTVSTRSTIGRKNMDGSYDVIYCHSDGYPSYNGKMLYEHYQGKEKVDQLIALGDLSVLGEEIGEKHPFDTFDMPEMIRERYERMCRAYGRDRGEKNTEADHYESDDALAAMLKKSWTEWVYIYHIEDGKWYYTNNPSPTWFKCCGTEQKETSLLTPEAWEDEEE